VRSTISWWTFSPKDVVRWLELPRCFRCAVLLPTFFNVLLLYLPPPQTPCQLEAISSGMYKTCFRATASCRAMASFCHDVSVTSLPCLWCGPVHFLISRARCFCFPSPDFPLSLRSLQPPRFADVPLIVDGILKTYRDGEPLSALGSLFT